ncbi:MobQ family relaxase, partial [Asticcacaulis benevestitus]
MAIYHLSMKTVSRASGRSAVGAAAYRSGTRLTNERDGLTHDYTRKGGIEHSEIVLPDGSNAEWARDRETLWNAAEFAEKRKDARVAREIEVALPHELTGEQRLELVREFSQGLADRYDVAVDFALHTPDQDMDIRNHHAHIMFTTRQVTEEWLGDKTDLERENKWLKANDLATTHEQLKALRVEWEETANLHLARAGHDIRIDHRSHQDRGLEIEPTQHVGVHATQMDRHGKAVERERLAEEARVRNAELIRENPDQVLTLITGEKSVFDRRDVARTLHRYINDDPSEYQALYSKVMASDELVRISDGPDGIRYSTKEMIDLETGMARDVSAMSGRSSHGVKDRHVDRAIDRQGDAIRRGVAAGLPDDLAADQRARL